MRKPYDCPKCGNVFSTFSGARNHMKDVHGGGEPRQRPKPKKVNHAYESLADIAVEAKLKRMMGEPLDPLERSLLNE
jgi:uncharacterized C2H2 Zn-finger protein